MDTSFTTTISRKMKTLGQAYQRRSFQRHWYEQRMPRSFWIFPPAKAYRVESGYHLIHHHVWGGKLSISRRDLGSPFGAHVVEGGCNQAESWFDMRFALIICAMISSVVCLVSGDLWHAQAVAMMWTSLDIAVYLIRPAVTRTHRMQAC